MIIGAIDFADTNGNVIYFIGSLQNLLIVYICKYIYCSHITYYNIPNIYTFYIFILKTNNLYKIDLYLNIQLFKIHLLVDFSKMPVVYISCDLYVLNYGKLVVKI